MKTLDPLVCRFGAQPAVAPILRLLQLATVDSRWELS